MIRLLFQNWIRNDLSTLFNCSSVYLTAIIKPHFPECYYSRANGFWLFWNSVTFVVLTVDNFKFYIAQDNLTWMKMILFSAFCTNHKKNSGSGTSSIGCLATISRPCISIWYRSAVISSASSFVRGHRKFPFSIRLYRRRNPSPSQISPFMRSVR